VEQTLGDRPVVVARELTKIHEEFLAWNGRGNSRSIGKPRCRKRRNHAADRESTAPPPDDTPLDEAVSALERVGIPRMEAIKQVARRRGLPKREVYDHLLQFTETVMPV